jgi:hypothetical protein
MLIGDDHDVRNVTKINESELALIKAFVQGAIYSWAKNIGKDKWFAVRDLFGGDNYYWQGTPLEVLWAKQKALGKFGEDAIKAAAKDLGWITKSVIYTDKRSFETRKAGLVNQYKWTGQEDNDDA